MTDEIALTRKTERATHAQRLLDDDLFKEAFATLDDKYVKAWRESEARDDDGRQRTWTAVRVLAKVKEHFETIIINGKVAQAELSELAERRTLAERVGSALR